MEKQEQNRGFWADFRHFFFRGLTAVLPSLVTLVLIVKGYQFINDYVGHWINQGIIRLVAYVQTLIFGGLVKDRIPDLRELWDRWFLHIGGFIIAVSLIYFFGVFLASFVGRWLWRMIERLLNRTPVVGQVYPYVKQVTDFLFSGNRLDFTQVVAVEYPRKGIWSLGLATGAAPRGLGERVGRDLISIFIPSSPTPLTGYVICVPRSEVMNLPVSVDEAFRFVISGGVLKPGSKFIRDEPGPAGELPGQTEGQQD